MEKERHPILRALSRWGRPGEPLDSSPEEQLAARRAAFGELARVHEAELLRVARRMCSRDEEHARDLVQDTFVRAYEAYVEGRFRQGSNARAWLLRILTNGFINDYRRQKWEANVDL